MKTKDFALEVKDLSEDGTFEGYGSIFGNVDSYGEKVVPGAFVESLAKHRREGTSVLMLWQHNPDEPIGVWDDLAEDAKGLWGKGRLIMEVQRAKEVYALLRAKAVRGLSIGYRELDTDKDGVVRVLKKLDLWEISPVSFPANSRARRCWLPLRWVACSACLPNRAGRACSRPWCWSTSPRAGIPRVSSASSPS